MTIDLILRSQSPSLLERMLTSAKETASGPYGVFVDEDKEGLPKCASTYNRLAAQSKADILCILHDDIEFLSKSWDRVASELFIEYKPDIVGVVGSGKYNGGKVFDSGRPYSLGHYCTEQDGKAIVKVFSRRSRLAEAVVVDGMFMLISRAFWEKNPFDESFDELFFFDLDLCLRAKKVGITSNILVKHSKPKDMYGKYPEAMKPIKAYWEAFHEKHGLSPASVGDQRCASISLEKFRQVGQNTVFDEFEKRYLVCV